MSNYYLYSNNLTHHGIKGQKWGKKNGPPYPLGSGDHSRSEERAGWRTSLNKAKGDYKTAKKTRKEMSKSYNKAYSKAYSYSSRHPISRYIKGTKSYDKSKDLWAKENEAWKEFNKANKDADLAKDKYKSEKDKVENKRIASTLGISEKEAKQLKKYAKIVGISLATTAGLVAAGYLISRNRQALSTLTESIVKRGEAFVEDKQILTNVNRTGAKKPYSILDKDLFYGDEVKNVIGKKAQEHGFTTIDSGFIKSAIEHPLNKQMNDAVENEFLRRMTETVRLRQLDIDAPRRLSCWSTANSYYLSAMTGREFCSKSFENLVDFNDFGKLYKTQPKIFDISGNVANDFVGKFGRGSNRIKFDEDKGKQLINNIFGTIKESDNTNFNGTRTVGFMNAAYRGMTCTHQWNFEIARDLAGRKTLTIVDGYAGTRMNVAKMGTNGKVSFNRLYFTQFMDELYHYNADSLRYYAPSLESIDPEVMSKIVLGKM